jgi:hypothetical protein
MLYKRLGANPYGGFAPSLIYQGSERRPAKAPCTGRNERRTKHRAGRQARKETPTMKRKCIDCDKTNLLCGCRGYCQTCYARVLRREHRHKRGTCAGCNQPFTTTRTDARFCSGACRQRGYRRRVTEKRGFIGNPRLSVTPGDIKNQVSPWRPCTY